MSATPRLPRPGAPRRPQRQAWRSAPADTTIGDIAEHLRSDDTTVVVVVGDGDLVLGALHPNAAGLPPSTPVLQAAHPGPPTVRPSITRYELARNMDEAGQHHVIVSTSHGRLIGIVRRRDLE